MVSVDSGLSVTFAGWQEILRHVDACLPEEACGFLGGRNGRVDTVLPVENADHSPFRFRMDPLGQLQGMQRLEAEGRPMLGIYHSHPAGPSGLSSTDALEAAYPEAALVVISPGAGVWEGRAFMVEPAAVREIPFVVDPPPASAGLLPRSGVERHGP